MCLIQKAHAAYFLTEVRLMAFVLLNKTCSLENSQHPKRHIVIDFQSFSCSHTIYHLIPHTSVNRNLITSHRHTVTTTDVILRQPLQSVYTYG